MIFLLGGPPRVGKSIIADMVRREYALSVVSTDSLGAVLEEVLDPETAPDLFVFDKFYKMPESEQVKSLKTDPDLLIEYVRKESSVVWRAVEVFIRREHNEKREALVEGVAVLPELMERIEDLPCRVVLIGNQGKAHKDNIMQYAQENEHDWMRGVSDAYVDAFSVCVNRMSAYLEQEADKYGLEYIEMDQERFEDVAQRVKEVLYLQGKRNHS